MVSLADLELYFCCVAHFVSDDYFQNPRVSHIVCSIKILGRINKGIYLFLRYGESVVHFVRILWYVYNRKFSPFVICSKYPENQIKSWSECVVPPLHVTHSWASWMLLPRVLVEWTILSVGLWLQQGGTEAGGLILFLIYFFNKRLLKVFVFTLDTRGTVSLLQCWNSSS